MLNQELELSLNMAFARAREHRHEFMTVEHLLLALLSNPSAREALEACSVDLVALRQELEAFIEQTTPVLACQRRRARHTADVEFSARAANVRSFTFSPPGAVR
ncbi:ATP-dependent Clp protease ATP-binding subunit [Citrobacter koseri]|uniref:ATP-dependent Clp protease ATP-binding subunit n=1 Tax=Citrobacter koseri TaxID=545 RepID=A0A2X2X3H7_CITKO|nr:ATP-dependent Clp protease ATP-binding subunit [Citrobacter koseri]